jgi:hypothetical protein
LLLRSRDFEVKMLVLLLKLIVVLLNSVLFVVCSYVLLKIPEITKFGSKVKLKLTTVWAK